MNSKLGDFFFFPCNFKFANYIQIFFFPFWLEWLLYKFGHSDSQSFVLQFVCLFNKSGQPDLLGPAMCPSESADPTGVQVSGLPLVAPHCFPEQILSHRRVGIEGHECEGREHVVRQQCLHDDTPTPCTDTRCPLLPGHAAHTRILAMTMPPATHLLRPDSPPAYGLFLFDVYLSFLFPGSSRALDSSHTFKDCYCMNGWMNEQF